MIPEIIAGKGVGVRTQRASPKEDTIRGYAAAEAPVRLET
jgi:hypothetical protein